MTETSEQDTNYLALIHALGATSYTSESDRRVLRQQNTHEQRLASCATMRRMKLLLSRLQPVQTYTVLALESELLTKRDFC